MTKSMVLENIFGVTAKYIKEIGKMGSSTDLGNYMILKVSYSKANGKMGKELKINLIINI